MKEIFEKERSKKKEKGKHHIFYKYQDQHSLTSSAI
jgi:hypothetical protein